MFRCVRVELQIDTVVQGRCCGPSFDDWKNNPGSMLWIMSGGGDIDEFHLRITVSRYGIIPSTSVLVKGPDILYLRMSKRGIPVTGLRDDAMVSRQPWRKSAFGVLFQPIPKLLPGTLLDLRSRRICHRIIHVGRLVHVPFLRTGKGRNQMLDPGKCVTSGSVTQPIPFPSAGAP